MEEVLNDIPMQAPIPDAKLHVAARGYQINLHCCFVEANPTVEKAVSR